MITQLPFEYNGKSHVSDVLSINLMKGNIYVYDDINSETAEYVRSSLQYLEDIGKDSVIIHINSGGGSVSDGLAIIDAINSSGCEISIIVEGMAASMAAIIVSCSHVKGRRYATPNSDIMIHQPLGGVSGQATDISIVASRIVSIKNKINAMLSEATGQPFSKIENDTERDTWFSAEQALEYGIIDKIIHSNKEIDK
jgi:ATP-dependent Clp protease protease subunit